MSVVAVPDGVVYVLDDCGCVGRFSNGVAQWLHECEEHKEKAHGRHR